MTADLDPIAAQQPAANPEASVWVAASAGTGKTKVLTDRVLSLMLHGTPPERILCLTFTKAAAAEMANRIHRRLGDWAICDDAKLLSELSDLIGHAPIEDMRLTARRLFARVLDVPGAMKIETIHGFCQSLLRRFPVEAGLAPHFQVMDERSAAEMLDAAREEILLQARAGGQHQALAQALAEATGHVHEDAFTELMAALVGARNRLRGLLMAFGDLDGLARVVRRIFAVAEGDSFETVIDAASRDQAFDGEALRGAVAGLAEGSDPDQRRGQAIARWLDNPKTRASTFADYCGLYLTDEGPQRKVLITKAAANAHPGAREALAAEAERLIVVADRRRKILVARATIAALSLGVGLLDAYERHKASRGLLDYDDLILMTRDLLQTPDRAPWVLFKLDGGLDHILVDESQDTNSEQWQIIQALAEEFFAGAGASDTVRTVFAVGDSKQSIFSFQGADPAAFERMRTHFKAKVQDCGGKWRNLGLDISFRSTASVLEAIDAVFAASGVSDGVAPPGHAIQHRVWRTGQAGLVELWPLVEPTSPPPATPWPLPVSAQPDMAPRRRLAMVIAQTIRGWIEAGELLQSKGRAIRPGDVMVLVRQRSGFVEELVRALKQLEVPVAGVDRMVLTEQLAVMDLIALGQFLLLPADDLALATVLKGPLVGLGEGDLFDLAHGRDGMSLWRRLRTKAQQDTATYGAAFDALAGLLAKVDYLRPFEFYAHVLNALGGREKLLRRLGAEADDPINEFLALALAYERTSAPSLQGFLHWIEAGHTQIKRDLEHSERDEVRVMTIHGAKGLEAPVVFLPDTVQMPRKRYRLLWSEDPDTGLELPLWPPHSRDEDRVAKAARAAAERLSAEEYRRLLYVAMTRAEDRLYICGWRGRNDLSPDCWYNLASAGLEATAEAGEFDFTALIPGGWSGPGLRLAHAQGAEPEPDASPGGDAAGVSGPLPPWAENPAPSEEGPQPMVPSRPSGADEPMVRSPIGPDGGEGFRRGRLIHRLLQSLPEMAPSARDAAARRFLAQPGHGLDPDDQDEIALATLKVLAAPELAHLFGPDSRAEVAVTGHVNGRVVSGQIDRLVAAADEVMIVDYKTNRAPPTDAAATPEVYLRQMAAYRALVGQIFPARNVRCALLWTDGPELMSLDGSTLDGYAP